jgi:hypothetical protein
MLKKLIIFLVIVSFLPGCKKHTITLTGSIELKCIDDYYIGASYNVHTEYDYINNKSIYGNTSLKSDIVTQTTIIDDLNPGTYIIHFTKTGWTQSSIMAVQITSGKTRSYNLSIYFN